MCVMDNYRRTSHTKFDIRLHFVWITKYRKPFLIGTIATRVRDLVRQVCTEFEVEILKGHVSKDHVHLYVSCPPHVSPSNLMQRIKGRSFRRLLADFAEIRQACSDPKQMNAVNSAIERIKIGLEFFVSCVSEVVLTLFWRESVAEFSEFFPECLSCPQLYFAYQ